MEEKYGVWSQWLVCAAMSAIGLLLMRFAQHAELPQALAEGADWRSQCLYGCIAGLAVGAGSLYTAWFQPQRRMARRTAESYAIIDLRGLNPVWISIAAGIGEEVLFRGGVQPLLGLWPTALLFTALHIRVYDFRLRDRTSWLQAAGVFAMGLGLGLMFHYVGLLAAILAHTMIDICGLYAVRRVAAPG